MLRESVWFAHISKLKCCETGFKTQLGFASKVLNHHVVLQKKKMTITIIIMHSFLNCIYSTYWIERICKVKLKRYKEKKSK